MCFAKRLLCACVGGALFTAASAADAPSRLKVLLLVADDLESQSPAEKERLLKQMRRDFPAATP